MLEAKSSRESPKIKANAEAGNRVPFIANRVF
jgi:hypothetical protein